MKKEKESLKISVILTTHNRADFFLPQAIESVLNQTFKDFELIIVDDASQDATPDVTRSFQKRDKRIRVIRHFENFGSDTRGKNEGILASRGKYIAYLDDDCEWLPYHLEKLVKRLENSPNVDLVYCDMWTYDISKPDDEGSQGITIPKFDGQFLLNRCFIDTSEVVHRREWAFRVGGWDESLPKFVDWNMWVRIMKAGVTMQRMPIVATNYYINPNQKSKRIKTKSWWDPDLEMTMFEPTFSPSGCYIYQDWLYKIDPKNEEVLKWRKQELKPKVAIFTLTMDRLDYTKRMWTSLDKSTRYSFDWYVVDNGSKDGTIKWLDAELGKGRYIANEKNKGISKASNQALDAIMENNYQIVVKVDNDCEFLTFGWLEAIVDLWRRNHLLYISPYPEGLVHNPGGAPRVGYSYIGPYFVEVAYHLSGLCAAIDARAYKDFRWQDQFLHGNQDTEASIAFTKARYMPCYVPLHRVWHQRSTTGQQKDFPLYFKRRIEEKRIQYGSKEYEKYVNGNLSKKAIQQKASGKPLQVKKEREKSDVGKKANKKTNKRIRTRLEMQ